ncbi:MAG TPA: tetratricopeptide repeat protein, partial [Sandaracinaceae bacterium LLY-WYZ-13_1]|nr:tetratricopeptide repeat protein [Sandaracinaceae bacterium LLY-WYZ-13_1]
SAPRPPRTPPRPARPAEPSGRDGWMARAAEHYRAGSYAQAAEAYQRAVEIEPGFAPAQRGLAVSRLRAGDVNGAARAYRALARLEPQSAAVQVGLARALTRAGDREGARAAYELALALDPGRQDAQRELAALREEASGAEPEPQRPVLASSVARRPAPAPSAEPPPEPTGPTLPERPSRDDIIRTMMPFGARVEACAPEVSGTVSFRMVITGATGEVQDVTTLGEHAGTPEAACWESHLRGARFPRFTRETLEVSYPFQLEGPPPEDDPES